MLYLRKLLCAALAIVALESLAFANDYQYLFNDAFSGSAPASANAPWVNATFRDIAPGTVELTVTNLALSGSENVDQLYFNLAPSLNPLSLTFTYLSGSGGFDLPSISTGTNQFKADGDGKYDVLFNFAQNAGGLFSQGEYVTYTISGIAGLTAVDFGYLSFPAGGAGPFYAATHVQRIGPDSLSGWVSADLMSPTIPVPEPGTGSFLGLVITICFAAKLWKLSAKAASEKARLRPVRIQNKSLKNRSH